jgi:hypothetical protein
MFRRRDSKQADVPVTDDPLALLTGRWNITQHGLPVGCWVYVLHQADGTPFYVGQSTSLHARINEHMYTFGGRFHYYSRIPCRDEHQMDVRELFLIDEYESCGLVNLAGTAEIEALRRRVHKATTGSGLRMTRQQDAERRAG